MKKLKKPLFFALAMLPVAAVAAYFTCLYQFDIYPQETLLTAIEQVGSIEVLIAITVAQSMLYAFVCAFFGYILADKLGLLHPIKPIKKKLIPTLLLAVGGGVLFSLDYWTFGSALPAVQEGTLAGLTAECVIASVLYGGIVEELMMRLFFMSLIAFVLWKLFFKNRGREDIPAGVFAAANIISALLFAAGHIPATIMAFGALTPLILVRCFLFNDCLGMLFGWLYRKYGIAYAMLAHAAVHMVSKLIWLIFV